MSYVHLAHLQKNTAQENSCLKTNIYKLSITGSVTLKDISSGLELKFAFLVPQWSIHTIDVAYQLRINSTLIGCFLPFGTCPVYKYSCNQKRFIGIVFFCHFLNTINESQRHMKSLYHIVKGWTPFKKRRITLTFPQDVWVNLAGKSFLGVKEKVSVWVHH